LHKAQNADNMDRELKIEAFKRMCAIRQFEELGKRLYNQNRLAGNFLGAFHSYIGEEAIAVGVSLALRKDDYVLSTHRGHGHVIAKGGELNRIVAELHGKEAGYSRGRGGSMHIYVPELAFLGGNGIVGGGIPLAIGVGYAMQYLGRDNVAVCFFGDGAASQGTFHESLNMAALWKLPVIFVCENNCYAVTTPVADTICVKDVACRAQGYGIYGKALDGNDVEIIYQETVQAVNRARKGGGPSLLECKTFRVDSHCQMLPEMRPEAEINEWLAKDPLAAFEAKLVSEGALSKVAVEQIKAEIGKTLDEAEKFGETSPYPDAESFRQEILED
jgi:TPP-dependent pyruvate/acetoin dehydrogenase alpha subunit